MKFNNKNIGSRTMIKTNTLGKCKVCGSDTYYLDNLLFRRYCSQECYDLDMDRMSKWAREETDVL